MKTLLCFFLLFISAKNYSQIGLKGVFVKSQKSTDVETKNSTYVKAYHNNIPAAIMMNFSLRYPGIEDVTWFVNDKEVSGYLNYKGQNITIAYKKDGQFLYERKTYDGALLCEAARDFLEKETGFAYPVKYVTEINKENEQVFEVSMEDEKRWHIYQFGKKDDDSFSMIKKTSFKKG